MRMSATTSKAGLVSRSVASCFLFKFPPASKPQVALFRRSEKVSTYRHKLAPISGSIEETDKSPIAAVWREINEETTLTPANLSLFRQGKPYSFTDEGVGRVWTVHPFAFNLKAEQDESRIRIDWEHEGWTWHDPGAVTDDESFGGVPFLAKSLRRVWFETDLGEERGRLLREGLEMLRGDHESGARQLAGRALEVFGGILERESGESAEVWWANARFAAWHLWKNGRESMGAAVLNVLVRALGLVEEEMRGVDRASVVPRDVQGRISARLAGYAEERARTVGRVSDNFLSILSQARKGDDGPIRILTLSSSSTILGGLSAAATRGRFDLDIRVLESRPLFEGVSMASKLLQSIEGRGSLEKGNVNVTVYSDASSAIASKDVDIVLLGADLVGADGAVSNKAGSLPAVLSAKHVSPDAKVIVLAEKEKILPWPAPEHDEENDSREVTRAWRQDDKVKAAASTLEKEAVQVKNVYFEWVSPDLIDIYISEDGERGAEKVTGESQRIKHEADRLFAES